MNLTPNIKSKIGKSLHNKVHHPINIIKNRIYKLFPTFEKFDTLDPIVSVDENFNSLLIPEDHPSRSSTDTYYVDEKHVMRTHTSAHQAKLMSEAYTRFLVTGDVYRRDAIDSHHYPIFHQMEGVSICEKPELFLHQTILTLLSDLFPKCRYRCEKSYFPFTDPSWEYEIKINNAWIEVLGCGLIRKQIIQNCGLDGEQGWAFGLGLDRLAMILFEIPDIRLFWSDDERFLMQFREGTINRFVPYSRQPVCYKDVSFWIPEEFNYNLFCEIVREIGSDLIESVNEIDSYVKDGRTSKCYRIAYRSFSRTLTNEEIDDIQERVRKSIALELKCELR
jgi:phenylalanyl-tRNA synthetase alpha chain